MKQWRLLIFALLALSACSQKKLSSDPTIISVKPELSKTSPAASKNAADSSITLFGDPAYTLHLHIFDKVSFDETEANAVLTMTFKKGDVEKVLLKDSLYCMRPFIEFKDFNNDKVKDLLVYFYSGVRSNERFHLYLVFPKTHTLKHVEGFEEVPNPKFDAKNNVIVSLFLSGSDYYSFYQVDQKNKLVNLGHAFEATPNDSIKFEAAIRKIKKDYRKD